MTIILIGLLFLLSTLLSAMAAGYATLSTSHLRHWAKTKDPAAAKLYPLKARGSATYLTIELLRALSLSGGIVMLTIWLNPWFAWAAAAIVFFTASVVLTQLYLKPLGLQLLVWLSAPLLGLTNALKPVTLPLGRVLDGFIKDEPVTLTREELGHKLDAIQPEDTDLTLSEISILQGVLEFSNHSVHSVMIPKRKVVTVKEEEVLTPVVLNELHKSGQGRFPVLNSDNKTVVGILNMLEGVDIKTHEKTAEEVMQKVYFVDEDRDLGHVLDVFYKTKQSIFVVHNEASDMVGILGLDDVLKLTLGGGTHKQKVAEEPKASEEVTLVVE